MLHLFAAHREDSLKLEFIELFRIRCTYHPLWPPGSKLLNLSQSLSINSFDRRILSTKYAVDSTRSILRARNAPAYVRDRTLYSAVVPALFALFDDAVAYFWGASGRRYVSVTVYTLLPTLKVPG